MTSKRPKSIARSLFQGARTRARAKAIPFEIEVTDVTVPQYCPILGLELQPGVGRTHDASPTLDRIVPERGYVPGNVVVISMRANRLKSDAAVDELRRIASFYDQLGE